jgi:hypothetical protein
MSTNRSIAEETGLLPLIGLAIAAIWVLYRLGQLARSIRMKAVQTAHFAERIQP